MMRPLVTMLVGLLGAAGTPAAADWPGGAATAADRAGTLGAGVSGLALDGTSGLWAVRDRGVLLHLEPADGRWVLTSGPTGERELRYPDGRGTPDAEAVTTVDGEVGAVYVGAERSNAASATSRNSVLRFDATGSGPLTAMREWALETVLGATPANTGVEALAWIPDATLVSAGLRDERGGAYAPADHPGHGGGLFAVAVEGRGEVVLVALRDDGRVDLVARAATGLAATMELSWSTARQELWAVCDDKCSGQAAVLRLSDGALRTVAIVRPPNGLADRNDEGFTILPTCTDGNAVALWAEDASGGGGGSVLQQASLPCAPLDPLLDTAPSSTVASPSSGGAPAGSSTAPSTGTAAPASSTATSGPTSSSTTSAAPDASTDDGTPWLVIVPVAVAAVGLAGGAVWVRRRRRA